MNDLRAAIHFLPWQALKHLIQLSTIGEQAQRQLPFQSFIKAA